MRPYWARLPCQHSFTGNPTAFSRVQIGRCALSFSAQDLVVRSVRKYVVQFIGVCFVFGGGVCHLLVRAHSPSPECVSACCILRLLRMVGLAVSVTNRRVLCHQLSCGEHYRKIKKPVDTKDMAYSGMLYVVGYVGDFQVFQFLHL